MSTYGAESFYRATIRQSIDDIQTCPFTLKVSKIPTLTTGLLTISPNTADEELVEYNGVDGTALTITVVKRGISPSTQALTVDGTDYNNTSYQNPHSQNDSIRADVNHLHIIQDYGNLQAQINTKVNTAGGVRTGLTANAIMRTNGSGVESADAVATIVPTGTDTVLFQRAGDIGEATYTAVKNDIAVTISPALQETTFESIIVAGDGVGQTPDGLYKVQQEVKTSTAFGGGNTYKDHCKISTGKYAMVYENGGSLYVVIASISSADAVTYGTPVLIAAAATPTARIALIDTDKIVIVYAATVSINLISVIATISGTVPTLGASLSEARAGNVIVNRVFKTRATAYAVTFGCGASGDYIAVNTVSGTTITAGTTTGFTFGFAQHTTSGCYLADNTIAFSEGITVNNQTNVKIYAINPAGSNILTTYTGSIVNTGGSACFMARYSDTEFVITNPGTTSKVVFTIPGAGTTLVSTTLTANAAANYPVIPLFTNIYAVNTGTTILVYQRDVLIGTITGTPAHNTTGITYDNGRVLFFSGATNIPNIINLAKAFIIGIANGATGIFTISKNSATKSSVLRGYRYYTQSDGTISNGIGTTNTVVMTSFFGRGVLADKIMVEV